MGEDGWSGILEPVSIQRHRLSSIAIPMLNRLIFNMGIPIPGKDGLYIEMGLWLQPIMLQPVMIKLSWWQPVFQCHGRSKTRGLTKIIGWWIFSQDLMYPKFCLSELQNFSFLIIILFTSQMFLNPLALNGSFNCPRLSDTGICKVLLVMDKENASTIGELLI